MARVVFFHGLESRTDDSLLPVGGKARLLRAQFQAETPALDTRVAQASKQRAQAAGQSWTFPLEDSEACFEIPMQRARAAIGPDTELLIGSSFGGAVLLRLLHEEPQWRGRCLFLAMAGIKLTPYRQLPEQPCLLVHGREDRIVPCGDSQSLAATSPLALYQEVEDGHRLKDWVDSGGLSEAVRSCLSGAAWEGTSALS